jgi:hypothetical protein
MNPLILSLDSNWRHPPRAKTGREKNRVGNYFSPRRQYDLAFVRYLVLLLVACLLDGGCAAQQTPSAVELGPRDPHFPTVSYLKAHDDARLDECLLAPLDGSAPLGGAAVLQIHFDDLWRYANHYARHGNDCPQGQLESDCAHFQAHCLAAAGIRVDRPTATCAAGLTLRVRDLAIAFDNASVQYANVKKIRDYRQARRGDWCFLPRESNGGNPHDHMMLLAAAPDENGAPVYSHTNNRNGVYIPFDATSCLYYRIEDNLIQTQRNLTQRR